MPALTMANAGESRQEQKSSKAHGEGRRMGKAIAAAAALAISAMPMAAHARPKLGMAPPFSEKPPTGAPETGRMDASEARFPGGAARVEVLGEGGDFTNMRITYQEKDWERQVSFFGPVGTGRVTHVLLGRERTVVITENNVIVTLGYEAARRGQRNLEMEGAETRGTTYYYDLPDDVKGYEVLEDGSSVLKLQSAALVDDAEGGGATLFFIGRNGHLRATRVERYSEPYASTNIEVNPGARLISAGSVAILAEPGRNAMLALNANFEMRMIERELIALPAVPEGVPEMRTSGGDAILSFGNIEVLVLVGEPGNPHSVTIAATGQ